MVELKLPVAAQAEQIAELERQLAADSRNSSRPPSSDGLRKKPAPRSLRQRTGRKPGRGKGDAGGQLEQVACPDRIVDHRPDACRGYGSDPGAVPSSGFRTRQVFDLPEVVAKVTEYRLHQVSCDCGTLTGAQAPDGASAAAVYGVNPLTALRDLFAGRPWTLPATS